MLPDNLTFIDLETTGTSPTRDRVIEIGIVRVEKGKVKEKFDSLVDPGIYLPPEITMLTGISSDQLTSAPTFRNLKETIDKLVLDSIVVAHNANFDVSFMKNEYERLNDKFKNKYFCTVRLSRMLFPRIRKHNLDSIISRFGIKCKNRHRAFDDAYVLWEFYKKLKKNNEQALAESIKKLMKKRSLPAGLSEKLVNKLPSSPGVYIFYGDKPNKKANDISIPLYIGKSVNIKARVMSHFNSISESTKELSIARQIKFIEHEETSGELSALLRERELIAKFQPIYNRQLRLTKSLCVLTEKEINGYKAVEMSESTNIDISALNKVAAIFKTKGKAKNALAELADKFNLCYKFLGLEKGKGACFRSQIEKCNGACVGDEAPLKYNLRFIEAFSKLKLKSWPFDGAIVLMEGNIGHIINNWCYLGIIDENTPDTPQTKESQFDYDTYKILVKFLLKPEYAKRIKIINHSLGSFSSKSSWISKGM